VATALDNGYATTIHSAQGATIDTAHALAAPLRAARHEGVYVSMPSFRESNHP
jgi:ATP-dependent exoDNAse (exonuclease V) alpha subunit